jgi:hypothetical protein
MCVYGGGVVCPGLLWGRDKVKGGEGSEDEDESLCVRQTPRSPGP